MMSQYFSEEDYKKEFGLKGDDKKQSKALEHALDIRKFEISLYWRRAAYFWTFIAAALEGYSVIQASSTIEKAAKTDLSVFLSCLGIVFSFGWYCANRGSKRWQENWEKHVELLEDNIIGPLYKVTFERKRFANLKERIADTITGPRPFSVSKINQVISLFVTFLWIFLLFRSLPEFNQKTEINWEYVIVIFITFLACIMFVVLGRTNVASSSHSAKKRESSIDNPEEKRCKMENAIREIIETIQKGKLFDSHFIINQLIKRYSNEYLIFASRFVTANEQITPVVHGQIAQVINSFNGTLIRKLENESWSENIRGNPSECACWGKL
jgi:hypothetical protein